MGKKAKWLSMVTIFMTICCNSVFSVSNIANAQESFDKPYYIIDENFSFILNEAPSGWDVKSAGGKLTSNYNTLFRIADNSDILPVIMNKAFSTEKTGKLTLEYRFNFTTMMSRVEWQLRYDSTAGVSLIVKDGNLCLEAGKELKVLASVEAGKDYGIKAVIDIDQKKSDVYVNGDLKAQGADFKNAVDGLNNFQVKTGEEAKGEFIFMPVKLYKGYIVNERLISAIAGQFPSDWQVEKKGGNIAIAEMKCSTKPDIYSFKLDDTSASESVGLSKTFDAQGGPLAFEYRVFFAKKADGVSAELFSQSDTVFRTLTSNGSICYTGTDGKPVPVYTYIDNLWYRIKLTIDPDTSKADLYINGKQVAKDLSLLAKSAGISKVRLSTGKTATGTIWLDDILLYGNPPLPEDYVPEPVAVSASPYIVGMQNCSMWREGSHIGWDSISGWPDRTPYLGFFDEGDSEEADWELKWLAEHGVDFQMYFFFRPNASNNNPIKDPYLGYGLMDGYFNAKYSDKVKFAISWENGSSTCGGSEDYRKNLVPFWIEYYFKDPRYLKIDNKPVFSFLTFSGLKRDFGNSIDSIKAEIDYLRKACKAAGFDDVIVLTNYSGSDKKEMEDRKAAGIDYIYAYSWGYSSGLIETQKNGLLQQQKLGTINMIPTLGMGRDDTAWGRPSGTYAKPEDFKALCAWTKDTFMPSLPEGSLGKKMVLLDNWNEFGEGHFMMPAGLAGFGYLDAIRDVFTSGGAHEDARPNEAQLERISKLYPSNRFVPAKKPSTLPVPDEVAKGWYFDTADDTEGWQITKQVEGLQVKDGAIMGTSVANDPGIISEDNLSIDIDNVPYVRVRIKNGSSSGLGRIYFVTENDGQWNEEKGVSFISTPKSDSYQDCNVYMWDNKNWKGKLKQIRIDPTDTTGDFSIDKIELLALPGGSRIKVTIDGVLQRYEQPPVIINGRTMVPLRAIFEALGARIDWDGSTKTVTAFKAGTVIQLTIGDTKAYINKKLVKLDQEATIVNNSTLVPVRFIGEALGAKVDWDEQNNTVVIKYNGTGGAGDGTVAEPSTPNLIKDPGMEGSRFTYSSYMATPTFVKTEFHSGKQALQVVAKQEYGSVKFPVTIEAGKEYYYSAWLKRTADTKGTVLRLVLSYNNADGKNIQTVMNKSSPSVGTTEWTQVSCTYMVDKAEKISDTALIIFLDKPSGPDTYYLDDVAVKAVSGSGSATTLR